MLVLSIAMYEVLENWRVSCSNPVRYRIVACLLTIITFRAVLKLHVPPYVGESRVTRTIISEMRRSL